MTRSLSLAALFMLCVTVGCGSRGPALAPVEGKVTLDGKPVEKGSIRFAPTGGASPAGAEISGGRYSAKVPAGECKVEITAPKVTGKRKAYNTPDSPEIDIIVESVPEKYNTKSELKFTVDPKSNTKDFDLLSK